MANVIAAIAMKEVSLAKIINAETSKVNYVNGLYPEDGAEEDATSSETLPPLEEVMESVEDTIGAVSDTENALMLKLACAIEGMVEEEARGSICVM